MRRGVTLVMRWCDINLTYSPLPTKVDPSSGRRGIEFLLIFYT
jgi:hypothetical protein